MEQKFDINKVIEHYNLNVDEVAEALFPNVRYKRSALGRVLSGEATIDTEQIQKLASLAGVIVSDLFMFDDWKGSSEDGCITFIKGEYKAKLNYNGAYLTLYKGAEIIAKEITAANSLSINSFINHINDLIKNYGTN